ncbi:MAG: hypothetical protein R3B13_06095 [Polyangiaceae bacterium]
MSDPGPDVGGVPAPGELGHYLSMWIRLGWLCLMATVCACSGEGEHEDEASSAPDPSCASGTRWTGGNAESPLMQPGHACIACHDQGEGPRFDVAGTVYGGEHEANACYGFAGAQIILHDATGRTVTLDANSAGNFSYRGTLTFPLQAEVAYGGASRAMAGQITDGDCNGCHSASGTPGRIQAP